MAQLVEHATLDFGSGHDLAVQEIEPCIRLCADSAEPVWDTLPSLSALPPLTHTSSLSLSLSQNKKKKKL